MKIPIVSPRNLSELFGWFWVVAVALSWLQRFPVWELGCSESLLHSG